MPLKPGDLTERITPSKDVFVLSHVGVPRARSEDWWLDISGLVDRPTRLSFSELSRLPKKRIISLHECAGFPMAPHIATRRYANVEWSGIDLAELLKEFGVQARARFVWSFGLDAGVFEDVTSSVYLKDFPLSRISEGGVLLAYEMNGEPLDCEHGFPLRLIVPGYYGTNSVKWLYRLELSEHRPEGPFTTKYYNDPVPPSESNPAGGSKPVWEIAPESVIVSPKQDETIEGEVEVWGWAWAEAEVERVEISTDGGQRWFDSELEDGLRWAWRRFRFQWSAKSAGQHILMSRAIDRRGESQPMQNARNCVFEVIVNVI
ncbi:MAG TPA: molybdopterin-dependent oxidoreductase [Afipia sp.]